MRFGRKNFFCDTIPLSICGNIFHFIFRKSLFVKKERFAIHDHRNYWLWQVFWWVHRPKNRHRTEVSIYYSWGICCDTEEQNLSQSLLMTLLCSKGRVGRSTESSVVVKAAVVLVVAKPTVVLVVAVVVERFNCPPDHKLWAPSSGSAGSKHRTTVMTTMNTITNGYYNADEWQ